MRGHRALPPMRAPTDRARVAGDRRRLSPVLEPAWMLPEDITSDLLKKVFQARSLWFLRTPPAQTSVCPAALKMLLARLPVVLLQAISLAAQSPTCWEVPSFKPPPSQGEREQGYGAAGACPQAHPSTASEASANRPQQVVTQPPPGAEAGCSRSDRRPGGLPACLRSPGVPRTASVLCYLPPGASLAGGLRTQVGVLHLLPPVTHSLRLRRRICARPRHATSCSSVTWRFLCRRYDFTPGPRSLRCGSLTGVRH